MAYPFKTIEEKWQAYWLTNKSFAALDPREAGSMPKKYILDMFPYPSGAGLHVGHPEGYTATDIISRYFRMKGFNVLHPMGWDAFGLPAEQYAIKTNTHPRLTTQQNITNFRRQIQSLGLSYDWDREVDTTDPAYYRWTQWIFLRLFNSYFDPRANAALPVESLMAALKQDQYRLDGDLKLVGSTEKAFSSATRWAGLSVADQRLAIDRQRLAYVAEVPVNWCAGLGTVLANEEVIDGRSEVGGFPVERRPMRQWMLRITAYAERLLGDLGSLDWSDSLKEMQRNWIGRSTGAEVDFVVQGQPDKTITVFTTRPDTLYGATYMVLAPEHPMVAALTTSAQRETVAGYQAKSAARSERDRLADAKEKTGVFTGAYAINPVTGQPLKIYIADYVLLGYGTGAIMAVPAHDQRDWDFAKAMGLPIVQVVAPPAGGALPADRAYEDDGLAVNSGPINGLGTDDAKARMTAILEEKGVARGCVRYKLRDWLFSRQRYWGEPFPIVLDSQRRPVALRDDELPVTLPDIADFKPTGTPEPPLSKAGAWLAVERDGEAFTRETNTMPQWAGSCWYYLRYMDPRNTGTFLDKEIEKYWMPVDLYVGGVEHAVLHLLYARFWHKVLFDLGLVSTKEPFQRLVNQGLILGETEYHVFERDGSPVSTSQLKDISEEATDQGVRMAGTDRSTGERVYGRRVSEDRVHKSGDGYVLSAKPDIRVDARSFKMSKSRGNVVNPDAIVGDYGADCFRLYEMYMGPLEAQKPWNTRDIVGMSRFLNSVWRNTIGEDSLDGPPAAASNVVDVAPDDELDRLAHRAIAKVSADIEHLHFNTAIAELIKLNNEVGRRGKTPRAIAETMTLLLAPFAPHMAEEMWAKLGHGRSLAREPWPQHDPAKLVDNMIEVPVQVNGKLRDKVSVPREASADEVFAVAIKSPKVAASLEGKTLVKKVYVTAKMMSLVVKG